MSWLNRPISQTWYVLVLIVAAVVALSVAAGCASEAATRRDGPAAEMDADRVHENIEVARVQVDGRQITCLVYQPGYAAAGMSCDWSKP